MFQLVDISKLFSLLASCQRYWHFFDRADFFELFFINILISPIVMDEILIIMLSNLFLFLEEFYSVNIICFSCPFDPL